MSMKGKLRRLNLRPPADVRLLYQDRLSLALVDAQPGWLTTERVMQKAALATLNHTDQVAQDTWLTTIAHEDIERHVKEVRTLQQQLRQPLPHEWVHPMLMKARRALRNCVSRHKGIHRRKLANTAVRCGDARQEGEALAALAKGHDLSLQQSASQKPPISPTIFTAHFEQLFSKTSDESKSPQKSTNWDQVR